MKMKTGMIAGLSALCVFGFGVGVKAASNEQGSWIEGRGYHHEEVEPCHNRNTHTTGTDCIYGHQDCDGVHEETHHQEMQSTHRQGNHHTQRCH